MLQLEIKDGIVGNLPPGTSGSITDLSNGYEEILVFSCAQDDSHSLIEISQAGATLENDDIRMVYSASLKTECEIKAGGEYRRAIVTKTGKKLVLIFKHII